MSELKCLYHEGQVFIYSYEKRFVYRTMISYFDNRIWVNSHIFFLKGKLNEEQLDEYLKKAVTEHHFSSRISPILVSCKKTGSNVFKNRDTYKHNILKLTILNILCHGYRLFPQMLKIANPRYAN